MMLNHLSLVLALAMSQPSIRILCLHGYLSNARHLQGSMRALQKRMDKSNPQIELHFLQDSKTRDE